MSRRARERDCARASRTLHRRPARTGQKIRHAGAIFLGPLHRRSAGRLLRRAQSCLADLRHGTVFVAARCVRFQKRTSLIQCSPQGVHGSGQDRRGAGARRGPDRARALGRISDQEINKFRRRDAEDAEKNWLLG